MVRAGFLAIGLLIAATAAAQTPVVPAPPYYAMSPNGSPTGGPVQQQVLENYRTQLLQTQREMLRQNPSGFGPDQRDVNRRLNAIGPGAIAAPPASGASMPPSFDPVPFGASSVLPQPPFNAAPRP